MIRNTCRNLRKLLRIISNYFSNCWLWTIGKIKMFFAWFKAIFRWLFIEAISIWLILIVITVPVLGLWWKPCESHARYAGFFLQVAGICTVAWEVRKTRLHFDQPGFLGRFVDWVGRFPKLGGAVLAASGASAGFSGGRAYLSVFKNDDPKASIKDRLAAVVNNQLRFKNEIQELSQSTHQELLKQKKELDAEKKEREAKDQDISNKLKQAHTSGLHISMIGVIWLIIGVALATLPEEITRLITYLK